MTPAERVDLEQVAAENDTNLSDMIREAVNDYVADFRERAPFRGTK